MKTKQLIEKLKKFDPDAEIVISTEDGFTQVSRVAQFKAKRADIDWNDEPEDNKSSRVKIVYFNI